VSNRIHDGIVEELLQDKVITQDQLSLAKITQKNFGTELIDILIQKGFINKEQVEAAIAKKKTSLYVSLLNFTITHELTNCLSPELIKLYKIIPYAVNENSLTIAESSPLDNEALNAVRQEVKKELKFVLADANEINDVIKQNFTKPVNDIKPEMSESPQAPAAHEAEPTKSFRKTEGKRNELIFDEQSDDAVEMVQRIIQEAALEGASDIHIEPKSQEALVRVRIHGTLEPFTRLPRTALERIISRIKILSKLDVAETRLPQDGNFSIEYEDKSIDLRVATYPTTLGEGASMRLSVRQHLISLEQMGLSNRDLSVFLQLINRPHGIILITGPTGSGKTTTLYAALLKIDRATKRVLTVEDPVEHDLEGVVQTQVNTKAGITFPIILRSMLREDPDVIMVGEIRDQITAEISLRAAMTGHLVVSTLHTNSAIDAIARLSDLGLDHFLISSTLRGVMAQRLVRRICPHCKEKAQIPVEKLKLLEKKYPDLHSYEGRGCKNCHNRGYVGRIGIFEIIPIDETFRVLINNKAPDVRLREKALELGCPTLLDDGIAKVKAGLTSLAEVLYACEMG
jgi:type IV pilus assembly protein PilB